MYKIFKPASSRKAGIVFVICTSLVSYTTLAEDLGIEDLPEDIVEEISNSYQNRINPTNRDVASNTIEQLANTFTFLFTQKRGLKTLLTDFPSCHFAVNGTNGVPQHVTNIDFAVETDDAQNAASTFLDKYKVSIAEILDQPDISSLIWGSPPMLARGNGAVPRASVRLTRTISNIPVDDDGITISLVMDEKGYWVVTGLSISWTDGLPPSVNTTKLMSLDNMEASIESNLLAYSDYALVVGTRYPEIMGRLVLVVEGDSFTGATIAFLDATSGRLLKTVSNEQDYDYSGVLKAPATVPFEEAEFPKSCFTSPSTNCHPLPYASIYDNSAWLPDDEEIDLITEGWPITEDSVYSGSISTILGTSDYGGNFSVTGASGYIYVDQNKGWVYNGNSNSSTYAFDFSNKTQGIGEGDGGLCRDDADVLYECSAAYFATPVSVNTSQTEQYAERTSSLNDIPEFMKIRQEIFFHLNYAAFNLEDWGIPIYKPVKYRYHRGSGTNNWYCSGTTRAGAIRYSCGMHYDDNTVTDNCKEIEFRRVLYHEYGHTALNKMGTSMPDGIYGFDEVYHEAASTTTEILLSQFESARRETGYVLGANRKWPMAGQDDSTKYLRAGIFTSVFLDIAMASGYLSVVPIYDSFLSTPTNTVMVGQCSSVTDPSTCPGNSYYQRVIAAGRNAWGIVPWWRQDYEISKAFWNHIEDAVPYSQEPRCGTDDCGTDPTCPEDCQTALFFDPVELADKDDFPMFDDVTDYSFAAAFMNQDVPTVSSSTNSFDIVRYTPDPTPKTTKNQQLWFSNSYDYDVFSTYLRAGITYRFYGFGSGTLPCITLFGENRNWLAESSTCSGSGTYGYLSYTPAQDGIYLMRFSPGSAVSQFGPNNTYLFYRLSNGDDYPEEFSRAVPLPVNFSGYASDSVGGRFNTANDIDTLYFYRGSAGYGEFSFTSGSAALGVIVDSDEMAVAFAVNNGSPVSFYMSEPGRYYVRMYSDTIQQYMLNVTIDDEDLGGGGAGNLDTSSAFLLSEGAVSNAPRVDGRYSSVRANLSSVNDKDYFEFEAERGDVIHLHTTHLADGVDTVLTLYAPTNAFQLYQATCPRNDPANPESNRRQLALLIDDDGGTTNDGSSRLAFVAPVDGMYLVEVKSAAAGSAGAYTLEQLRRTDVYSTYQVNMLNPILPGE